MQPGLKYCILAQTVKKNVFVRKREAAFLRRKRAHARAPEGTVDPIDLKFSGMIQMPKTFKMTFLDF